MWTKIKWGIRIALALIVVAFLHYTLPQRDVVRVLDTYNRITPIGGNWIFYSIEDTGTGAETDASSRDIRFISAEYADGGTMTYRNEDTGWFWPPYFKWDSAALNDEAIQASRNPDQWVAITHYGWRLPIISVFPNAVSINPVSGPDVRLIPWVNITILAFLGFAALFIRAMWLQFRERMVDPTLDRIDARADAAAAEVKGVWGRIAAWIGTWRKKR